MKILFPTAFSMHARQYFQYAAEFAYKLGGELIMMHTFVKTETKNFAGDDLQNREKLVVKELKEFVDKNLPVNYNIKISYLAKEGGAASAILSAAKEKVVGLIVMGMRTKMEEGGAYIGEVAREIMESAPCPVLVIPPSAKFAPVHKFVYNIDFEFRDLAIVNDLLKWCKPMNAQLNCVHFRKKGEKQGNLVLNVRVLRELYGEQIKLEIIEENVHQGILQYIRDNDIDILTLAIHNRTFFERLFLPNAILMVVKNVNKPILVFKYA